VKRELSFAQWVLLCGLVVWPLNFYFSRATTSGSLKTEFAVHGALLGAIIALLSAVRDLRRVHEAKTRVPAANWPQFGATFATHWPWLIGLLPLLLRFRFNKSLSTTSTLAGGGSVKTVTATAFGWGGDASTAFAVLVALALLAHVWRRRVEAAGAV
jgi:hypothetical protein